MTKTDRAKSNQIERSLRDGELDAVTGGMFNAFANFGDIKGECTDGKTPSPLSPVPIPYPVLAT
jgi:hypothetical protein